MSVSSSQAHSRAGSASRPLGSRSKGDESAWARPLAEAAFALGVLRGRLGDPLLVERARESLALSEASGQARLAGALVTPASLLEFDIGARSGGAAHTISSSTWIGNSLLRASRGIARDRDGGFTMETVDRSYEACRRFLGNQVQVEAALLRNEGIDGAVIDRYLDKHNERLLREGRRTRAFDRDKVAAWIAASEVRLGASRRPRAGTGLLDLADCFAEMLRQEIFAEAGPAMLRFLVPAALKRAGFLPAPLGFVSSGLDQALAAELTAGLGVSGEAFRAAFFAALAAGLGESLEVLHRVEAAGQRWQRLVAGAPAHSYLPAAAEFLFECPVLTTSEMVERLRVPAREKATARKVGKAPAKTRGRPRKVSPRGALKLVRQLQDMGILRAAGGSERWRVFYAPDLISF